MMTIGIEHRLVKLRNELRSQKAVIETAYSTMLWPENNPHSEMRGLINYASSSMPYFRAKVVFTRTDRKKGVPFVDLTVDSTLTTDVDEYEKIGVTVTGRDKKYADDTSFSVYVVDSDEESVTFYIDESNIFTHSGLSDFYLKIAVISPVPGKLSVERLI